MARTPRVTVVTAGHLSTCPRMLKAADAMQADGYDVRVVATRHEPWATETDVDVHGRRRWPLATIDYRRQAGATYWRSGVRYRAARAIAAAVGVERTPLPIVARAFGRVHAELVEAASAAPADLVYGGTTGALAAVAEAARRLGVPYGVDFEDLHHGESSGPDAALSDGLAERVTRAVIDGAAFITTSSDAIADAYRGELGASAHVVHNTFPLPATPPSFARADAARLRVYWFSQTIGGGRGLEDAVLALGVAGVPATLALRGRPLPGYLEQLAALARGRAPRVTIEHLPPAPPDAMVDLARGYDVGLALEQLTPRNRRLCVTNKAFTYILAGAAVAITDTPGQHALGEDLGQAAALVTPGDVEALAAAFSSWFNRPALLECAKRTAWNAAQRRWHWEHAAERGRLSALVRRTLA